MILLAALPTQHPDRNRPLAGAWYRWKGGKTWRQVKPNYGIAGNSFNELSRAWTDNDDFTFESPPC